jgi:glutamyl-tRNA synthetase
MTCRTRFAPSPTGFLHIGGARTALFCWLEARHRGGDFVLRIEDTDRERSTKESVDAILDGMTWLGLGWDEGPVFQTSRFDRYRDVAEGLVAAGKAYYAYETREELDAMRARQEAAGIKPRYDGYWRERSDAPPDRRPVIRFKNPVSGKVAWEDRVKGRIEISNEELDDLIIWRSDDHPTYNFAVVVDDVDMRITDVIRGDDHVNNTPRQINLYEALGAQLPAFAHLPMIHGPDGAKLSKRHGAVSVMQYRDDGYLPWALLNYIARLGWSHGDQEIFSLEEMTRLFDISDVNHSASRFDFDKLRWVNQHWLKHDPPERIAPHLEWQLRDIGLDPASGPRVPDVVVALRDRCHTLREMADKARVWYAEFEAYDEAAVAKHAGGRARDCLAAARIALAAVPRADWSPAAIDVALRAAAESVGEGLGKVAQPLRVAMTGTAVSPSIDQTVFLVGQTRAIERIERLLSRLPAPAG